MTTGSTTQAESDRLRREAQTEYDKTKAEAQGAYDQAKSQAAGAAEQAKAQAAGMAERAKERVVSEAEAQKEGVASRVESVADRVHRTADDLRGDEAWLANALDRGASQLDELSTVLRERDLGSMVGQVERFARNQPALFLGASVAAGFALARFMRSSTPPPRGYGRSGYGYDAPERYRGYGDPYSRHDYGAESDFASASRRFERYEGDSPGYSSGAAPAPAYRGPSSGTGGFGSPGVHQPGGDPYTPASSQPSSSGSAGGSEFARHVGSGTEAAATTTGTDDSKV